MYASMRELLKKIPMIQSVVGKSKTELRSQYYDWKLECKRRWQRGDFTVNNNLQILCGVSQGSQCGCVMWVWLSYSCCVVMSNHTTRTCK